MAYYDKLLQAAEYLRSRMPFTPKVGIVLGSGLNGLVDAMGGRVAVPCCEIPNFPHSHVEGPCREPGVRLRGQNACGSHAGALSLL